MIVVIESPFRGSKSHDQNSNVELTRKLCRAASLSGFQPFASHLFAPQFLDDEKKSERDAGIQIQKAVIHCCREVWVWDFWGVSPGMRQGIGFAEELNRLRADFNSAIPCRCGAPAGKPCGHPEKIPILYASHGLIKAWSKIIIEMRIGGEL